MSGSGSPEGFGSPPWDPAEPSPGREDTRTLPGLGANGAYGPVNGAPGLGANGAYGPSDGVYGPVDGAPGLGANGAHGPANGAHRPSPAFGPSPRPAPGPGQSPVRGASPGRGPSAMRGPSAGPRHSAGPGQPGAAFRLPRTSSDGGQHRMVKPGSGQQQGGDQQDGKPAGKRARRRSFWRELPVLVVIALVLALVIKTYAIQAFFIPSGSMQNTLEIGDRVLVNKLVYDFRGIHRGDIIVFDGDGSWDFDSPPASSNIFSRFFGDLEGIVGISHDSDIYIKRVIGLPGDHVKCCNAKGQVTVNGVPLTETSYLYPGNVPSADPFNITVPKGSLWVMGDHRAVSYDSRGHMGDPGGGSIPESAVIGRAFVIIWPPSQWGFLNIPATFEQPALNASNAAAGGSTAALAAALDNGTPLRQDNSPVPLAFGFAGAVPLTWLQRSVRRRLRARRANRGRGRLARREAAWAGQAHRLVLDTKGQW